MNQKTVNASGDMIGINITFKENILAGGGGRVGFAFGEGVSYGGANLNDGYSIYFGGGTTTNAQIIYATNVGVKQELIDTVVVPDISGQYQTVEFYKNGDNLTLVWNGTTVFNEEHTNYSVGANTYF